MHKLRIAVVIAIGLIVLTTFCPATFAADQGQALIEAAQKGDLKQVQGLLEKGADVNAADKDGVTALMCASSKGHAEILKVLLAKGADIEAKDNEGWTPLTFASNWGHVEVVKILLADGADINTKASDGWTALFSASAMGHAEVVKVLLAKGADIGARDKNGATALMWASREGHAEVVKILLAKGADFDAKASDGLTALLCASSKGHVAVVKALLAKGVDINANDNEGHTPLMPASAEGHAEVVKALLDGGADVNAKDKNGSTALRVASLKNHPEVVELLKAHGAKSLSDSDMWGIAVLLLIAFPLLLFARIARKRRMVWIFFLWLLSVWFAASFWFLAPGNDDAFIALGCFALLSIFIADLIAIPILRRRVIPPCVRVKGAIQSGNIAMIIVIVFVIFKLATRSFHPFGLMIFFGLVVVFWIITLIRSLFGKIEICGNGVWQYGSFQPWGEYESFSWQSKENSGVELRLVSKSWMCPSTRLAVPREDREAVQQILEANLTDQSTASEAYSG